MCCTSDGGWRRVGHILPRILSVAGPNENSQRFSNQCISFVVRGARLLFFSFFFYWPKTAAIRTRLVYL